MFYLKKNPANWSYSKRIRYKYTNKIIWNDNKSILTEYSKCKMPRFLFISIASPITGGHLIIDVIFIGELFYQINETNLGNKKKISIYIS